LAFTAKEEISKEGKIDLKFESGNCKKNKRGRPKSGGI
jgi:hypothetical protein